MILFPTCTAEQVAERQGLYLARLLNRVMKAGGGHANSQVEVDLGPKFVYKHLGSMATVGRYKALVDLRQSKVGCSSVLCESLQFTRRSGVELSVFFFLFAGLKGHIHRRICKLVHLALSIPHPCCQLEK